MIRLDRILIVVSGYKALRRAEELWSVMDIFYNIYIWKPILLTYIGCHHDSVILCDF